MCECVSAFIEGFIALLIDPPLDWNCQMGIESGRVVIGQNSIPPLPVQFPGSAAHIVHNSCQQMMMQALSRSNIG